MTKIYVIPKEGMMVPDPQMKGSSTQVRLPSEGKLVDDSTYWQRRLKDGDVAMGKPPANKAPIADAKSVKAGE